MSQATIVKMIQKLCEIRDVEWVYYLPSSYKKIIEEVVKENPETIQKGWLAEFLYHFILLSEGRSKYDTREKHNIIFTSLTDVDKVYGYSGEFSFAHTKELVLKKYLEKSKAKIDDFHQFNEKKERYYGQLTALFDRFAVFKWQEGKKQRPEQGEINKISNAWLKCWEIIHSFKMIPYQLDREYKVFCNAEFPGSFIFAIHHYIKTKTKLRYDWVASSLWPNEEKEEKEDDEPKIFGDRYGLYKKYQDKWLMNGKDRSGNVLDKEMLTYVIKRCNHEIDLYTSDIGIALNKDTFHLQEELETPLNLGQIVHGLSTLREGGNMICKMFMFFTNFNQSMLFHVSKMFSSFYITKPVTSRPGNSEIYIVGMGFKGYTASRKGIERMETALFTWEESMSRFPLQDVSMSMTNDFYLRMVYSSYLIYRRQIQFIKDNITAATEMYSKFPELSKNSNQNIDHLKTIPVLKDMFDDRENMVKIWAKQYPIFYLRPEDRL
jgi:hypothetical protein